MERAIVTLISARHAGISFKHRPGVQFFAFVSIILVCLAFEGMALLRKQKALCDGIEMLFLLIETSY